MPFQRIKKLFVRVSYTASLLALLSSAPGLAQLAQVCEWNGPTGEWVLSRRLNPGSVAGSLGSDVMPYLHNQGIPLSFVSSASGDVAIQLEISPPATFRDVLQEILRQAPDYRYDVFGGRMVIYPASEGYETPVTIDPEYNVKRSKGLFDTLRALSAKAKPLRDVKPPVPRTGFGGNSLGDIVEIGGARPVIEHLMAVTQGRPSLTFIIKADKSGRRFELSSVTLVQDLELTVPPTVAKGAVFEAIVKGRLVDGTVVSLEGPGCLVKYGVVGDGVLAIDDSGLVTALTKGTATILVRYEDRFAQADVQVQEDQAKVRVCQTDAERNTWLMGCAWAVRLCLPKEHPSSEQDPWWSENTDWVFVAENQLARSFVDTCFRLRKDREVILPKKEALARLGWPPQVDCSAPDLETWLGSCVEDAVALSPGTLRPTVRERFVEDGGMSMTTDARFVHRRCSMLKIRVAFKLTQGGTDGAESPDDEVQTVYPYIGFQNFD